MIRKRRRKSNKKIILLLIAVLILYFIGSKISLAKYVYNAVHDFYLGSKGFFFNSDKLSVNKSEFEIENNWSGAETYYITINMNSKKNDLVFAESDIVYNIKCTSSDNIECTLSKEKGTIIGSANGGVNEDYFIVTINPATGTTLKSGDTAWIEIEVTSESPYVQTLSGKLIIGVGAEDITYEIIDSPNTPYAEVNITNSLNEEKLVTLAYDYKTVLIDMTNNFTINATNKVTEKYNGYDYIKEITSKIGPLETISIKFYKIKLTEDYTYEIGDKKTPIISLSY